MLYEKNWRSLIRKELAFSVFSDLSDWRLLLLFQKLFKFQQQIHALRWNRFLPNWLLLEVTERSWPLMKLTETSSFIYSGRGFCTTLMQESRECEQFPFESKKQIASYHEFKRFSYVTWVGFQ